MIFTIQNLGFAIGGFLLEGWLAFAARCVCALVLLALGAVARALLRKKIFPKLLAHSWHFEATGHPAPQLCAAWPSGMVWLTGIYLPCQPALGHCPRAQIPARRLPDGHDPLHLQRPVPRLGCRHPAAEILRRGDPLQ